MSSPKNLKRNKDEPASPSKKPESPSAQRLSNTPQIPPTAGVKRPNTSGPNRYNLRSKGSQPPTTTTTSASQSTPTPPLSTTPSSTQQSSPIAFVSQIPRTSSSNPPPASSSFQPVAQRPSVHRTTTPLAPSLSGNGGGGGGSSTVSGSSMGNLTDKEESLTRQMEVLIHLASEEKYAYDPDWIQDDEFVALTQAQRESLRKKWMVQENSLLKRKNKKIEFYSFQQVQREKDPMEKLKKALYCKDPEADLPYFIKCLHECDKDHDVYWSPKKNVKLSNPGRTTATETYHDASGNPTNNVTTKNITGPSRETTTTNTQKLTKQVTTTRKTKPDKNGLPQEAGGSTKTTSIPYIGKSTVTTDGVNETHTTTGPASKRNTTVTTTGSNLSYDMNNIPNEAGISEMVKRMFWLNQIEKQTGTSYGKLLTVTAAGIMHLIAGLTPLVRQQPMTVLLKVPKIVKTGLALTAAETIRIFASEPQKLRYDVYRQSVNETINENVYGTMTDSMTRYMASAMALTYDVFASLVYSDGAIHRFLVKGDQLDRVIASSLSAQSLMLFIMDHNTRAIVATYFLVAAQRVDERIRSFIFTEIKEGKCTSQTVGHYDLDTGKYQCMNTVPFAYITETSPVNANLFSTGMASYCRFVAGEIERERNDVPVLELQLDDRQSAGIRNELRGKVGLTMGNKSTENQVVVQLINKMVPINDPHIGSRFNTSVQLCFPSTKTKYTVNTTLVVGKKPKDGKLNITMICQDGGQMTQYGQFAAPKSFSQDKLAYFASLLSSSMVPFSLMRGLLGLLQAPLGNSPLSWVSRFLESELIALSAPLVSSLLGHTLIQMFEKWAEEFLPYEKMLYLGSRNSLDHSLASEKRVSVFTTSAVSQVYKYNVFNEIPNSAFGNGLSPVVAVFILSVLCIVFFDVPLAPLWSRAKAEEEETERTRQWDKRVADIFFEEQTRGPTDEGRIVADVVQRSSIGNPDPVGRLFVDYRHNYTPDSFLYEGTSYTSSLHIQAQGLFGVIVNALYGSRMLRNLKSNSTLSLLSHPIYQAGRVDIMLNLAAVFPWRFVNRKYLAGELFKYGDLTFTQVGGAIALISAGAQAYGYMDTPSDEALSYMFDLVRMWNLWDTSRFQGITDAFSFPGGDELGLAKRQVAFLKLFEIGLLLSWLASSFGVHNNYRLSLVSPGHDMETAEALVNAYEPIIQQVMLLETTMYAIVEQTLIFSFMWYRHSNRCIVAGYRIKFPSRFVKNNKTKPSKLHVKTFHRLETVIQAHQKKKREYTPAEIEKEVLLMYPKTDTSQKSLLFHYEIYKSMLSGIHHHGGSSDVSAFLHGHADLALSQENLEAFCDKLSREVIRFLDEYSKLVKKYTNEQLVRSGRSKAELEKLKDVRDEVIGYSCFEGIQEDKGFESEYTDIYVDSVTRDNMVDIDRLYKWNRRKEIIWAVQKDTRWNFGAQKMSELLLGGEFTSEDSAIKTRASIWFSIFLFLQGTVNEVYYFLETYFTENQSGDWTKFRSYLPFRWNEESTPLPGDRDRIRNAENLYTRFMFHVIHFLVSFDPHRTTGYRIATFLRMTVPFMYIGPDSKIGDSDSGFTGQDSFDWSKQFRQRIKHYMPLGDLNVPEDSMWFKYITLASTENRDAPLNEL